MLPLDEELLFFAALQDVGEVGVSLHVYKKYLQPVESPELLSFIIAGEQGKELLAKPTFMSSILENGEQIGLGGLLELDQRLQLPDGESLLLGGKSL